MAMMARTSTGSGSRSRPTRAADGDRPGRRRGGHGEPKPYFAMIAWPSAPSRKSMNAWSTSWFFEVFTVAIGYLATTLMSVGDVDPRGLGHRRP